MSKVLFIAVHPDDETLGCGGTILKHKAQGDEIYWLLITSNRNHPLFSNEDASLTDKMIQRVSKSYRFDKVYELNYPAVLLHTIDTAVLIQSIDAVLNEVKPNIIYTMFHNDVHSDHRVAFDALYACTKSFRKSFIDKIYMIEALSETEFAPPLPSTSFIPNVFVDITDYMDKKLEIMSMYDTEMMEEPYPRSLSSIKALARIRGSRAGVMYAEAFMLLFEKQ